jgi:hypothetical protein
MRKIRLFGSILRRGLVFAAAAALITINLVAGLWLLALAYPAAVFNDHTLSLARWGANKLGGIELSWQKAHLSVSSTSFTAKVLRLTATRFCVTSRENRACFGEVDTTVELVLNPTIFPLKTLGPVRLRDGDVAWTVAAADADEAKEPTDYRALLARLRAVRFEPLEVQAPRWQLTREGTTYSGAGEVVLRRLDPRQRDSPWSLRLTGDALQGSPLQQLTLDATAAGLEAADWRRAEVSARLHARLKTQKDKKPASPGRLAASFDLTPRDAAETGYDLDVDYLLGRQSLHAVSRGTLTASRVSGRFEVAAADPAGPVAKIALEPCAYVLRLPPADAAAAAAVYRLRADCAGRVRRAVMPSEASLQALVPRDFPFKVAGHGRLFRSGRQDRFDATLALDLRRLATEAIDYGGGVRGRFGGVIGAEAGSWRADVDMNLNAAVKRFATLVELLRFTAWAVPAPLNVLDGSLNCGISGRFATTEKAALLPMHCATDLRSASQSLVADAAGTLEWPMPTGSGKPRLDATVNLNDVAIDLPEVRLGKPLPAVVRDKRIAATGAKTPSLGLDYDVRIKTINGRRGQGGLAFISNLSKTRVPMDLDLRVKRGQKLQGTVQVAGYRAELFRRQAFVDHLRLRFAPDGEAAELDGLVIVDTNDYKISLLAVGTTAKPRLQLYSEPPLPERDLMAILLFGRQPEGLEPDQKRSADETRAAVADGAIGLLSMYYLASTPVESVGYNPHSGMFTAKVALAKGLSLTVGTNVESESQLGLRKRIGRNWTAETTAVKNETDESTKGVAMLTWSKRY